MTDKSGKNDKDLIGRIKSGDSGAMRMLYDRYVEYLSAVCARYIPDEDDRKDILQESFIKVFSSIDKFEMRGENSLKSWMLRIVINESLSFLKKSKDNLNLEQEELLDTPEEPEIDEIPDNVINDMILSLPPGYRMVFNLYVFEEKSHKEIAEMLNIGASSSASQFSRAKAQLAKKIKEYRKKHIND
ncbi:MAG: RNA polymerase sigma factor [Prevotella sp.]|nr:RNA polymerase sigma factor [Prevotella sp.]